MLIFLHPTSKKAGKVKIALLENSSHHATHNRKWWEAVVHPWRNEQMFRVEVWQLANPKGGEEEGGRRKIRLIHCDFWNVKGLMVFFRFARGRFLLALIQSL